MFIVRIFSAFFAFKKIKYLLIRLSVEYPDHHRHLAKTDRVAPQVGTCKLLQSPSCLRYLPATQVIGAA